MIQVTSVPKELLSSDEAARRLTISRCTLYDWLCRSDAGEFLLRGRPFTIEYFQGGSRGQGRIQIEAAEVERIQEAMRVRPTSRPSRKPPTRQKSYPGITVPLGRPDE